MILFLNRNDEKWSHTRQKILPVEITFFHRWEMHGKRNMDNSQEGIKLNVKLSKMSSTRQSSS
jgi:hypothetical protein